MKDLITDEMLEAALEYLAIGPDHAGQAKADLRIAEAEVERVYSILVLEAPDRFKTAELRKAWAKAHPDYQAACKQDAEAERMMEWHRRKLVQAQAILDAWRTAQATTRAVGRFS